MLTYKATSTDNKKYTVSEIARIGLKSYPFVDKDFAGAFRKACFELADFQKKDDLTDKEEEQDENTDDYFIIDDVLEYGDEETGGLENDEDEEEEEYPSKNAQILEQLEQYNGFNPVFTEDRLVQAVCSAFGWYKGDIVLNGTFFDCLTKAREIKEKRIGEKPVQASDYTELRDMMSKVVENVKADSYFSAAGTTGIPTKYAVLFSDMSFTLDRKKDGKKVKFMNTAYTQVKAREMYNKLWLCVMH